MEEGARSMTPAELITQAALYLLAAFGVGTIFGFLAALAFVLSIEEERNR